MFVVATPAALVIALLQSFSQAGHRSDGDVPAADSVRIVRAARSAQASFESFRRARLPLGHGFSGPCDVRIGRYCYWRGDGDDDEQPPAEAAPIRERRDALIRLLDSATATLDADPWLAGQYVRYLTEAARFDDAFRFATSGCHATPVWCNALAGYAAHTAGRFATADSAYRAALDAMEPAERCRWLDVSDLLDGEVSRRFKAAGCDGRGREAFVRRLFWIAAPLYSMSGTDLLTEHLARLTRARMAERSAAPDGSPWADDERELVVRYGWPRWYSRSEPSVYSTSQPAITGHDAGMPYNFLPSVHALDHLGQITPDDWHLEDARATTGYAPSYARSVHDLEHQMAMFRRGESTLVVAAWDARRDTTLLGRSLEAALVIAADDAHQAIERRSDAGVRGTLSATGVLDSGIVSLELLAAADRRAARVRLGIPARSAERVAISDLLLYTPAAGAAGPNTLEAVRDSALASDVVPGSRALGVFWETYGLRGEGEPVRFTLTVEQTKVGWMRRAAEHLGFADPTTGLRVQWEEVPQRINGVAGRGVRVDLSRLRAGHYRIQVLVAARGEKPVSAERNVVLR